MGKPHGREWEPDPPPTDNSSVELATCQPRGQAILEVDLRDRAEVFSGLRQDKAGGKNCSGEQFIHKLLIQKFVNKIKTTKLPLYLLQ